MIYDCFKEMMIRLQNIWMSLLLINNPRVIVFHLVLIIKWIIIIIIIILIIDNQYAEMICICFK